MLAIQLQSLGSPDLMGLSYDGHLAATAATITESVAERVTRIRAKMLSVGIPVAVGTGIFTTLTFAGAFGFARSERVWAPALWLGGVATVAGLVSVAIAAKTAQDVADEAAKASALMSPREVFRTPAPAPITVTEVRASALPAIPAPSAPSATGLVANPVKTALGYYYY
jgi:hypothetical protein